MDITEAQEWRLTRDGAFVARLSFGEVEGLRRLIEEVFLR